MSPNTRTLPLTLAQARTLRMPLGPMIRPTQPMQAWGPGPMASSPAQPTGATEEIPIYYYVIGAAAVAGVGYLVWQKTAKKSRKGRR